jgi:hypothetical protein
MLNYLLKQAEFQASYRRKQYCDADTVTKDKLLLFLVEEVTERPLRTRSRRIAAGTPLEDTRLAWRSIQGYISTLFDLYCAQKAIGMNTHPSPREDNVRKYLNSLQHRDA